MSEKFLRYLKLAQLNLFGWFAICLLLMPHFLVESNEGGLSNYGVYTKTILPYSLALGLGAWFTWRAAHYMPKSIALCRPLLATLYVVSGLYLAVLLSTYLYKTNHVFDTIHIYVNLVAAINDTVLSLWLAIVAARNWRSFVLMSFELVGFGLLVATYFGRIRILLIAELLTSLAFGLLLIEACSSATTRPKTASPHKAMANKPAGVLLK